MDIRSLIGQEEGERLITWRLEKFFREVKNTFSGLRIGYPAIGAGLAGGNRELISEIINEEIEGENHIFVQFQK